MIVYYLLVVKWQHQRYSIKFRDTNFYSDLNICPLFHSSLFIPSWLALKC